MSPAPNTASWPLPIGAPLGADGAAPGEHVDEGVEVGLPRQLELRARGERGVGAS